VVRIRCELTSHNARGHSAVRILLAAAIGFGFNAGFVSPLPSPAQAQPVEQPDTSATEQRDTISTLLQRLSTIPAGTWDNPVAFNTFVLAIFTALLALLSLIQIGFLIRLGKTLRSSADAAKQASEAAMAGQRAYVVAEPYFSLPDDPKSSLHARNIKFGVHWRNIGNLPTRNLRNYIDYRILDGELPDDFAFPDDASPIFSETLLVPKQVVAGPHIPRDWDITADQMASIRSGEKNLYIFGWAKYFDGFPGTPERVTKFCYLVRATINLDPPLAFFPHHQHNCADEDCDK
jgi:hypothetical protein